MPTPPLADAPVPEVVEIERALTRAAYLTSRVRQHERLMASAGVSLDRAAVTVLRQIADSEPLRPGELADRLVVEASHVTRQVQQLQKAGYVTRVADRDDRRARRIELTPRGRYAVDRIQEVCRRGMQMSLADWSPEELRDLAALVHRLVDDFLDHVESTAGEAPALGTPRA
ncbi:MarR family transcriptional regulator [Streptomyces sp. KM273126]|uniref:MarR family winged helix-turn-helix transcriptional regulator n=1 Tax=Streptomyces sp. KM273126 TaxID=2545247 RepID=UPI001039E29E|nr:MarR family transcriptional regulator [Streptomyces sp. KM273126]MBA2810713.1 MarR family transcriptional regulator [Streptomyces sp. KM273126]